ncbi:MAG: hypothetical protein RL441_216 [Actinomycetota bacterium]
MTKWWQDAVFYQIYPRSFMDSNGDGMGDLQGITSRLEYIASLGVDAIWLSPFYPSPQVDAGYDVSDYCDVDPQFGTLAQFDELLRRAHELGLKVTIDIVPNHCSNQHPWFVEAVAAGRGSAARARFHFVDGRGENGDEPPSNWGSVFGGPSWTRVTEPDGSPGQWYYHLFAEEQPDFNWDNPEVLAEFERIFTFWLDRGVDGFRIDVSDALIKDTTWPDTEGRWPIIPKDAASPVHDVYRALRTLMDRYDGDRMAVVETGAPDEVVALFIRNDEMHLAFNFRFVKAQWSATDFKAAIDESLAANAEVHAPTTWVIENHDVTRAVTRYGSNQRLQGSYIPGVEQVATVDTELGQRRARAAAVMLLSLPGAAYIYNGQELGLPNVDDLPDEVIQDPSFARTHGEVRGRDGCRIPLPWTTSGAALGFSSNPQTWLPMPAYYGDYAVATEQADPTSMLSLYTRLLHLRRETDVLRRGELKWLEAPANVLRYELSTAFDSVEVWVNFGDTPVGLPDGLEVIVASTYAGAAQLAVDSAAICRKTA